MSPLSKRLPRDPTSYKEFVTVTFNCSQCSCEKNRNSCCGLIQTCRLRGPVKHYPNVLNRTF